MFTADGEIIIPKTTTKTYFGVDGEKIRQEKIEYTVKKRMKSNAKYEELSKEYVLKKLRENGLYIYYFDQSIKNDKECVLTALKQNYKAYEYIGKKYKLDQEVIDIYWTAYLKDCEENYQRAR